MDDSNIKKILSFEEFCKMFCSPSPEAITEMESYHKIDLTKEIEKIQKEEYELYLRIEHPFKRR